MKSHFDAQEIYDLLKESFSFLTYIQINMLYGTESSYEQLYPLIEKGIDDQSSSIYEILLLIASIFQARPKQSQNIMNLLTCMMKKIQFYFSSDELIKIFDSCRRLVVFLYENKCINIDSIKKEFLLYDDRFLLFYPEIKESDPRKFKKLMIIVWLSKFVRSIENSMNIEKYKEIRRIGHDDCTVSKLIRDDDIENFQLFISNTNLDFDSKIQSSVFESNTLINQMPTLIEYSAFFGSINIFKFLLLQLEKQNYFNEDSEKKLKKLYEYSIVGGCFEIIHIVEGINSNLNLIDRHCIKLAISYHQNKIADYLFENSDSKFSFDDLILCIEKNNYEMFVNIFEDESFIDLIEKGLKDPSIIEIQNLLLFSLQVGNLTFFKFFLKAFSFDVNTLLTINLNLLFFLYVSTLCISNGIFFLMIYLSLLHVAVESRKEDFVRFLLGINGINKDILNAISTSILTMFNYLLDYNVLFYN